MSLRVRAQDQLRHSPASVLLMRMGETWVERHDAVEACPREIGPLSDESVGRLEPDGVSTLERGEQRLRAVSSARLAGSRVHSDHPHADARFVAWLASLDLLHLCVHRMEIDNACSR